MMKVIYIYNIYNRHTYHIQYIQTPLPPIETQTHQLLSGTYLSDLKKPETEMRSLMRINGDKLTLE